MGEGLSINNPRYRSLVRYPRSPIFRDWIQTFTSSGDTTMNIQLPMIAGVLSTVLFAAGTLPMVLKACVTKDLASYSFTNLLMANIGNMVHAIYVFNLPPGPIWILHAFYIATTALMFVLYLRYGRRPAALQVPAGIAESA